MRERNKKMVKKIIKDLRAIEDKLAHIHKQEEATLKALTQAKDAELADRVEEDVNNLDSAMGMITDIIADHLGEIVDEE
jgi:hypothetical protein